MQPSARDVYLETQVMTASPQKLRLMLVEGAIRKVSLVQHCWDNQRPEEALEASIRAREIISELIAPLSEDKSPLARQMLAVYVYLFRTLTEASLENDRQKLADVLRVLGEERETWTQVCAKFVEIDERPQEKAEIVAPQTLPAPAAVASSPVPQGFDSNRMTAPALHPVPAPLGRIPTLAGAAPTAATAPRGFSFEA